MLSFAFDGITSFSISPIRMISAFGAIVCVFAFCYGDIRTCAENYMSHRCRLGVTYGFVWFIGGVQLLSVGLIGEYTVNCIKKLNAVQDILLKHM